MVIMVSGANAQLFDCVSISAGQSLAAQTISIKDTTKSYRDWVWPGFNTVVSIIGKINKFFAITTDVGYIQKGYRYTIEHKSNFNPQGDSWYTQYEQTLHYITYSHQLKFGQQVGKFIPTLLLGPRVDYLVAYQGKQNIDRNARTYRKSIFGFNVGMDMTFIAGKFGLTALCQYQFDFTTLVPKYYDTTHEYRNKALLLNLGIVYLMEQD